VTERPVTAELQDANARGIARPRLHHFGIATVRCDEMVEWYGHVFGMGIVAEFEFPTMDLTFVTNDLAHHSAVFLSAQDLQDETLERKQSHTRIQHLAWEYETIDELLQTWERLNGVAIEPVLCTCHGVSFSFYYRDPDGNLIELMTDAWAVPGKSLEYMKSPELAADPSGGLVDPAKLIEARSNGVELDELRRRALAHEYAPAEPPGANAGL
jgi:catechol 2,3-dioxygenase